MKALIVILILLGEIFALEYDIERRVIEGFNGNGTSKSWISQPDRFIIPSSVCSGNGSELCTAMGGTRISNCTCECNDEGKSTFGSYDNQWKCTENTKVHLHGGCTTVLNEGKADSPLITVPDNDVQGTQYYLTTNRKPCYITPFSEYRECNGRWRYLDGKKHFRITNGNDAKKYLMYKQTISSNQLFTGRVIKISIGCYNESNEVDSDCVLLKMQGKIKCPFSLPTTTKITNKVPVETTSTASRVLSSITESTTSLVTTATQDFTNIVHHESSTTVNSLATTSSLTTLAFINTRARNTRSDNYSGLIAGAVAGVIGLVILIIIITLMRRRKKRNAVTKRTAVVVENDTYEIGEENSLRFTDRVQQSSAEDEYSYAYTNNVMAGQRINNRESRSNVTNLDYVNKIPVYKPNLEAPIYNPLEDPEYAKPCKARNNAQPCSSNAPIYNTLEEPEYTEDNKAANKRQSDKCKEPLYNVLEGPVDRAIGGRNEESPCYHVIEGPYPEGAPVFDILEEPESNEVLEHQQDPYKKCTFFFFSTKIDREENRGYNDTCYDSVGGVITDTEDIYQQLNLNSQRGSDVYQALSHPDKTMHLTKLNDSHSEA